MTVRAGLDVGGAHLKVAVVENGRTIAVQQFRCRLWLGLEKLETALRKAAPLLSRADEFAITMTGELSDVFPDRITGVQTIVARMANEFGPKAQFWMGPRGFGSADDARTHPRDVGSTNFLATAALAARTHPEALLIDFGSTTADIIPVCHGAAAVTGLTDAIRQSTGELVYTGFTRTAVMGVVTRAPFKGEWVTFAREHLATMADIRRILGTDLTEFDQHATADGNDKTIASSTVRLARMLGRDAAEGTAADWHTVASYVREEQLRSIHDGALQVLSRMPLPETAPVIAAGIGAADVSVIASRLGRRVIAFADLANAAPDIAPWATACAPAVSVALLMN
jgi:(4-(4-[2-(gamma-L-glutamylamino)ethyl]phenoxymethyl)furan-2-yl)methanamine synthase